MPEVSRFDSLQAANLGERMAAQRKSSNMSTSSDDSLRKISNDSGIGIGASGRAPNQFDDVNGDPRLSTDLSAAMLQLAHQQSLSAAALNPMLGLMSAGLWANPLATAMLQQEATARKLLESTGAHSKPPTSGAGATKPFPKDPLSMYPGFAGLVQPSSQVPDQLALSEALRGQLLNRKLSEEVNGGVPMKPTRKANSFSGTSSSPLHRQFSPPTSNIASPNLNNSPSPNNRHTGDEQQRSPYGDEDSVCSGKSSNRSRTPQPTLPVLDQQSMNSYTAAEALQHGSILNSHQFHPSSRKRKNGIIGSMPAADLSAYTPLGHPAFPAQPTTTTDIPMHKLSTASLPASLPSATHRNSLVQDPLSNRGSPATSRKRQRNIQVDEKDESYWERRRKNNEAAKRSRDSRRAKEDEIAIRAAFLEQENFKLRIELNKLKEELAKLQAELDSRKKPSGDQKCNGEVSEKSEGGKEASPSVAMESPGSTTSESTTTNSITSS